MKDLKCTEGPKVYTLEHYRSQPIPKCSSCMQKEIVITDYGGLCSQCALKVILRNSVVRR